MGLMVFCSKFRLVQQLSESLICRIINNTCDLGAVSVNRSYSIQI